MTATERAIDSILFSFGLIDQPTEDVIVQLIKRHKREVVNEFCKEIAKMEGEDGIDKIFEISGS